MTLGRSPDGEHYYPAFPYTAYSGMSSQDLLDLRAWLDTVEAVKKATPEHAVVWPVSIRSSLVFWKALFFDPEQQINRADRGAYLVNGPGHCAECHSSRNVLGGISRRSLTGNSRGPDGNAVPGITADFLSEWTVEDLDLFLEVGITPSGDFTGGHMADVVEFSTSLFTQSDRAAVSNYLLSEDNQP